MPTDIKIGTRGSALALVQARWVAAQITGRHPACRVELVIIKTTGDKIQDVPLAQIGGKGLFIKEIEEALLTGQVDLAVHSLKDMPAEVPEGLILGAVPPGKIAGTPSSLRATPVWPRFRPAAGSVPAV